MSDVREAFGRMLDGESDGLSALVREVRAIGSLLRGWNAAWASESWAALIQMILLALILWRVW